MSRLSVRLINMHTATVCIIWGAQCGYFLSLIRVSTLSTMFDTFKLQLVPSIKSHKLWCQARHYFCLYLWWARCQHLNWFGIFPVIWQLLGSEFLHHQITLLWILPIRRLNSLSDFQTGIAKCGCSCHTWYRVAFFSYQDCLLIPLPLQDSDGGVMPVQEVLNYSLRFMIFWTMLLLSALGIQLIF